MKQRDLFRIPWLESLEDRTLPSAAVADPPRTTQAGSPPPAQVSPQQGDGSQQGNRPANQAGQGNPQAPPVRQDASPASQAAQFQLASPLAAGPDGNRPGIPPSGGSLLASMLVQTSGQVPNPVISSVGPVSILTRNETQPLARPADPQLAYLTTIQAFPLVPAENSAFTFPDALVLAGSPERALALRLESEAGLPGEGSTPAQQAETASNRLFGDGFGLLPLQASLGGLEQAVDDFRASPGSPLVGLVARRVRRRLGRLDRWHGPGRGRLGGWPACPG